MTNSSLAEAVANQISAYFDVHELLYINHLPE